MIIKNKDELSTTVLRKQALKIVEAGIAGVLPSKLMRNTVKFNHSLKHLTIKNKKYYISKGRLFVIGGGKASGLMAKNLEDIIGPENITGGVVNCNTKKYKTVKIKVIEASHPMPDQRGIDGVKQMLALKAQYSIDENDLIICLISGGGSALMPYPAEEISLNDKQAITRSLIEKGPAIQEINTVRKHLSGIKGGHLGKFFSPTPVISLIISDVIGNDLEAIASGPTVPDSSTFSDAFRILEKYELLPTAPPGIVDFLKKGCSGAKKETPKTLNNCRNYIIGDNNLALEAMFRAAKISGLNPTIVTAGQKGDPSDMAMLRAKEIINRKYKDFNVILIGGETTPKLPDNYGKGGRNQHYAAVSMAGLNDYPGEWVLACLGTDGSDFLKDVAGAVVDNHSLNTAESLDINIRPYLDRYDSNTLLNKMGNTIIKTGDTGTNVGDIAVYIVK